MPKMLNVSLRPAEEIVATVRKHWILVTVPLLFSLALIILDFFLIFPLFGLGYPGVIIFLLLLFFALAAAVRSWILWRSTVFLVTNQRVIDVDRNGFFSWVISDVRFENMADISYETKGPFQALCRAGNVTVTTISGSHSIGANFVPNPGEVREAIIAELRGAERREKKNISSLSAAVKEQSGAADYRRQARSAARLEKQKETDDFLANS